jgi:hypothetical protein
MASSAFDNPPWPQPPNGAQYIQVAGNLAKQLSDIINGGFSAYQQGQNFNYQQQQRNLFQGGLPTQTDPNGNPVLDANGQPLTDYASAFNKMMQSGGSPVAQQLLPSLIDLQLQQGNSQRVASLNGGGPPQANTGPTSSIHTGPANLTPNAGGETVQTLTTGIAGGRGIEDVPLSRMEQFAKALGVNVDTPLSPQQETIARKLIGTNLPTPGGSTADYGAPKRVNSTGYEQDEDQSNVAQRLPNADSGPPGAVGGMPISPPPSTGGGAFREPLRLTVSKPVPTSFDQRFNAATAPSTPLGNVRDAENLEAKAREAYAVSARPGMKPNQAEAARKIGDQLSAQAKQIRETIQQYGAPQYNPAVQGQLHRFEGASKAVGDQIGEYVKAMPAMRQMVNQLNVIDDAVKSAKGSLTTGPGAESVLKMKQFLANVGFDVKGLPQTEVIQKMNAYLASEAAKQMTNRPSQMEFRAFMANNPGIMNSVQGTQILTDILRQTANQTLGLGKLGMNQRNWENWGDIEDRYFQQHPIRMPFSGNPASGQTQGQTPPGRYQWTPQGLQRVQ